MKRIMILMVAVLTTTAIYSQNKNARSTIEVDGVCGMCKQRIERASLNTKGVKSAVWNVDTHMLSLIFDERKTSLETIQEKIAGVGHDTELFKAKDEVYNNIDPCCKYRDEQVVKDHQKGDDGS